MKRALTLIGMLFATCLAGSLTAANANEYPLPPANSRLIGENTTFTVPNDGRPLEAIAADYKIGLLGMLEANPGTDPYLPLPGSVLTIPNQMLLPDTPREGIVINLAELRLYYYPKGQNKVIVYPIGIGQLGRDTPTMVTSISQKIPNPTWTPTANIRKNYLAEGITLPSVVPAGPDNPMGQFALRLSAGRGSTLSMVLTPTSVSVYVSALAVFVYVQMTLKHCSTQFLKALAYKSLTNPLNMPLNLMVNVTLKFISRCPV